MTTKARPGAAAAVQPERRHPQRRRVLRRGSDRRQRRLPDHTQFGDGPYPLVFFHGYGGGKINFTGMQHWLDKGYAVFSQTNRGFHESCGTATSKADDADCVTTRASCVSTTPVTKSATRSSSPACWSTRTWSSQNKIAATGGSYGGGMSMALAAKDRIMLPDGTYAAWTSPQGTPMSIAVCDSGHPVDRPCTTPWFPTAATSTTSRTPPTGPFGIMKQSHVNGLCISGLAPRLPTDPGTQPEADLAGWKAFMDAGEPFERRTRRRTDADRG